MTLVSSVRRILSVVAVCGGVVQATTASLAQSSAPGSAVTDRREEVKKPSPYASLSSRAQNLIRGKVRTCIRLPTGEIVDFDACQMLRDELQEIVDTNKKADRVGGKYPWKVSKEDLARAWGVGVVARKFVVISDDRAASRDGTTMLPPPLVEPADALREGRKVRFFYVNSEGRPGILNESLQESVECLRNANLERSLVRVRSLWFEPPYDDTKPWRPPEITLRLNDENRLRTGDMLKGEYILWPDPEVPRLDTNISYNDASGRAGLPDEPYWTNTNMQGWELNESWARLMRDGGLPRAMNEETSGYRAVPIKAWRLSQDELAQAWIDGDFTLVTWTKKRTKDGRTLEWTRTTHRPEFKALPAK